MKFFKLVIFFNVSQMGLEMWEWSQSVLKSGGDQRGTRAYCVPFCECATR